MAKTIMDHNSISTVNNSNANIRWAYTPLSYKNKDKAVPDEIILDKESGEFYYKKLDGTIIKCTSSSTEIIKELTEAIHKIEFDGNEVQLPTSPHTLFLSVNYPLQSRTTNLDLLKDIEPINDLSFFVSRETNGFFIKASSRSGDKKFIDALTHVYNADNNKTLTKNATVYYTATITDKNGLSITVNGDEDITLNEVSFVELDLSTYVNIETIVINITGLKSEMLKEANRSSTLQDAGLKQFISEDGQIIITDILADYFIDDISQIPTNLDIYGDIIKNLNSLQDIINNLNISAGLSEKDMEYIKSLQDAVDKIPILYVQQTNPLVLRDQDVFAKQEPISDSKTSVDVKTIETEIYDDNHITSGPTSYATRYNDIVMQQQKSNGDKEVHFPITRYDVVIGAPKVISENEDGMKEPFLFKVKDDANEY